MRRAPGREQGQGENEMALMRKLAEQAEATARLAVLQVSTAPRVGDVRLVVHAQPDAPLGHIDVQLGLGRGSKGRGQRVADDATLHVATVRRLVAHLQAYATDYEAAAAED